jgi:hypothetical protein
VYLNDGTPTTSGIVSGNRTAFVGDGRRLDPVRLGEKRLAFLMPAGEAKIELRCRRSTPAQTPR